jgi:putative FmdB family regulatory protein
MPRYDYKCQYCNFPFEVRMSMSEYSEGNKPDCPQCGSKDVERSFTSVGVLTGSRSGSSGPSFGGGGCGPAGSGFT